MLVISLISAVFIFLAGFSLAAWISRRSWILIVQQLRNEQSENKRQRIENEKNKKAINDLVFEISHGIQNASAKSFRGLRNIIQPTSNELDQHLTLLERPGHHRYATLARKVLVKLNSELDHVVTVCLKFESGVSEWVKRLNDL